MFGMSRACHVDMCADGVGRHSGSVRAPYDAVLPRWVRIVPASGSSTASNGMRSIYASRMWCCSSFRLRTARASASLWRYLCDGTDHSS